MTENIKKIIELQQRINHLHCKYFNDISPFDEMLKGINITLITYIQYTYFQGKDYPIKSKKYEFADTLKGEIDNIIICLYKWYKLCGFNLKDKKEMLLLLTIKHYINYIQEQLIK